MDRVVTEENAPKRLQGHKYTYWIIISCNRLVHFQIPVISIVTNLQNNNNNNNNQMV